MIVLNSKVLISITPYSKTCLQGTLECPRKSVPTRRVSLRNLGQTGHRSEKMSHDHRVSPHGPSSGGGGGGASPHSLGDRFEMAIAKHWPNRVFFDIT